MKRIFKSFMTALTLATFMGAFAVVHAGQELETRGARERLVDQDGVDILYSIDNYYTFIVGRLREHNKDEFTVSKDYNYKHEAGETFSSHVNRGLDAERPS
ncbi:MAG: hypothetical protein HZB82_05040 [Deltaproteobacteria bacterium]|nr:hypothetical protein [Deltaproteobacteria bacterium]